MELKLDNVNNNNKNTNDNTNNKYEDTLHQTDDIPIKNEHSHIKPFELSIDATYEYAKEQNDLLDKDNRK